MQSSDTNQEQHTRFQELPLAVSQAKSSTTPGEPVPYIGLPRRLTLPFSLHPKRHGQFSGRTANSNGLLRHIRLVSDYDTDRHMPPAPVVMPKENYESSSFDSKELISLLDTAVMIRVYSREDGWRQSDLLTDTLIEGITQQVTLRLPAVARGAEQTDQADQHKDITITAKGAAIAGVANLIKVALRYITNIAMTHMVSPTIYGAFGEIIGVVYLFGGLANLGFGGIVTYLLPAYRVKDERGLAKGLVRFSTRIALLVGFLVGALLFAFAAVIARIFYHSPSYEQILQEVAPLIPLMALMSVFTGGLQAFKEIKWQVCIELGLPLITLIALVIFYLLGWRMEALSFSAIGGFACSVLIGQKVFSKIAKRYTGDTAPRYTPRLWFGFALPLLFNGLIFNIVNTTDILFLSVFAAPAQAGIYIAADRISNLISMPLIALNIISLPQMTEYYAKGNREQLESIFKLVTKWSLSLSLPVCLCFLVFHDAILGIFGSQYKTGWLVLIVLCLGNLANPGSGLVFELLSVTRRLRIISIDSIITVILNIGLSLFLVPRFSILGAALAGALASFILGVLCLVQVYWTMKMHPYRWDVYKPVVASGVASLVGILLLHFVHFQPGLGPFTVVAGLSLIIPFFLVYVLMMILLGFSKEDRIVFHAVLARFGWQKSINAV